MKYYLIVHLAIIGNLFSYSDTAEDPDLEYNGRDRNDVVLQAEYLSNEPAINGSVNDSLFNLNEYADIEFMKLVIKADGKDWQAFQGEMKIPKSHFFRIIEDDSKYELARKAESNFRRKKFKLFCFNCASAFLCLTGLVFSYSEMTALSASVYLGGYVFSKILKIEKISVNTKEASGLARDYNQKLREEFRPSI